MFLIVFLIFRLIVKVVALFINIVNLFYNNCESVINDSVLDGDWRESELTKHER